jgi:hypothetical protein
MQRIFDESLQGAAALLKEQLEIAKARMYSVQAC